MNERHEKIETGQTGLGKGADAYRQLEAASRLGAETVEAEKEDYAAQAADTIATFEQRGLEMARSAYVTSEEAAESGPELQNLSRVLTDVVGVHEHDDRLRTLRKGRDTLDAAGNEELNKLEMNRRGYMHELRTFVMSSREQVNPGDLSSWLNRMCQDDQSWVDKMMSEVAAEVAVHDAVGKIPGVSVRFGSVEEAVGGRDVFVRNVLDNGPEMTLRVQPIVLPSEKLTETTASAIRVGVPNGARDGYALQEPVAKQLRDQLVPELGAWRGAA